MVPPSQSVSPTIIVPFVSGTFNLTMGDAFCNGTTEWDTSENIGMQTLEKALSFVQCEYILHTKTNLKQAQTI